MLNLKYRLVLTYRGTIPGVEVVGLKKLVLDVLKPLKGPSIIELAEALTNVDGVDEVSINVNEIDVETVTLTIIIEGEGINFKKIREIIEDLGAVIHSIDHVTAFKSEGRASLGSFESEM